MSDTTAMLPASFYWLDFPDGSYLRRNYACIATVKPRDGRWETVIKWGDACYYGRAGSLAQGKRWIERWVSVRGIPPR